MRTQTLMLIAGLAVELISVAQSARAQDMTLVINPRTGQMSLRNVGAMAINLDGYLLTSSGNALSPTGWTSLQDSGAPGWREANPATNHLSETNLLSSRTVTAGGAVNLGAAYVPFTPTAIGEIEPQVTFDFHIADSSTISGSVLYAPANNLVLRVNPATGAASIQNQSNFSIAIDGYTIASPLNVLAPASWTSFIDNGVAGWREANPAANHLSETNLLGSRTLGSNSAAIAIGSPINAAMLTAESDLVFDYHIAGGATIRGYVAFELPSVGPVAGDFDVNSRVDGRDFLAWQRGFGGAFGGGDFVDWKTNFGFVGSAAAAAQVIPEPNSLALVIAAGVLGAIAARRGSS
jgi:hypothetical protein